MSQNKEYLGDAVYADLDGDVGIVLTTENGIDVTNEIFLEHAVITKLYEYCKKHLGR